MRIRLIPSIIAAATASLGLLPAPVSAAPDEQLLGTSVTNGVMGAGLIDDSFRQFLAYGSGFALSERVGDGVRIFPSTSPQVFEFRSDADDADYSALIGRLTNGTVETMGPFASWWNNPVVGQGSPFPESQTWGTPSDFAAAQITGLRLTVDPFRLTVNNGITFASSPTGGQFQIHWDVLGQVPEPTGAAVAMFASAGCCIRPRRRR